MMRQIIKNITKGVSARRIQREIEMEMVRSGAPNHFVLFRKAAIAGDNELARLIVEGGNVDPQSLLYHLLAYTDDLPVLRIALALGADPNMPNDQGIYPLSDALNYEAALVLLDAGADPYLRNDGYPFGMDAFDFTARLGRVEVLRALAERADINQLDEEGLAPLHRAAMGTNEDPDLGAFFLLAEAGADPLWPDGVGRTGLALAREAGWLDESKCKSLKQRYPKGWTALERAVLKVEVTCIQEAVQEAARVGAGRL